MTTARIPNLVPSLDLSAVPGLTQRACSPDVSRLFLLLCSWTMTKSSKMACWAVPLRKDEAMSPKKVDNILADFLMVEMPSDRRQFGTPATGAAPWNTK